MKGHAKTAWKAGAVLLVTAAFGLGQSSSLSSPAEPPAVQPNAGQANVEQQAQNAGPGTVNYVEGAVTLDGQPLSSKSVGSTNLKPQQVISTGDGYVEVLLTPGAFLRVGRDSAVRFISAGLADSSVELTQGSSMVEVDQLIKGTNLTISADGASTRIEKNGLYAFDATQKSVRVLDGKASVSFAGRSEKLGKHDEVLLASDQPLKKRSFDENTVKQDALYVWSKARSEDEAQASLHAASNASYYEAAGPGWFWDPYYLSYGFWPVGGPYLGSPFGWGFYSPAYFGFYGGGFYGGGIYPGYYGRYGYRHDHDGDWRGHAGYWHGNGNAWHGRVPAARVGGLNARVGGVHAAAPAFRGGGFHGGGGGGFHGGGGGGFHGGGGGGFHGGGGHR